MSFINNPLISSLASSVGLGGLTSAGGADPALASATPKVAPKASPPNQPEYKQARFFDPRSPGGSGSGASNGQMPTEPGALSPDVQNNPTVMDLLNHFGVHPQQQVDPGLFIHNANAWANHPVMSGVLDGLMSGLANTKGSDTLGQGLSNVAQGLEETHDQKVQHINAQLMMPYNQAMTVANLQSQATKQSQEDAQQKYNLAHAAYMDHVLGARQEQTQTQVNGRTDVANIKAKAQADAAEAHARAQSMKPPTASAAQWQGLMAGNLNKVTKGRDLSEQPETQQEVYQATQQSLQDLQAPKTQSAIKVKNATPGSSAASMITANKSGSAQVTAEYKDADKDLSDYTRMKPSQKYALLGHVPSPAEDAAEIAKRTDRRNAARNALPGGPSNAAAAPSKYSATNPYATGK